jgi:3-deoxy-D-manno-octulosonic-acid transferase
LIFKPKARAGLLQKLGIVPVGFCPKPGGIWFHAVSVGEFNAIKALLDEFHSAHPGLDVVVSTTTATGQKIARDSVGSWAKVVFLPFDLPWSVSAWLDRARPQLVVISETEIWPGLVYQCTRRSIKVVAVNGRLSPRSFGTYSRFGAFFAWVFGNFTAFGVQSEAEAARYRELLGPANNVPVEVLGNLKLDGMYPMAVAQIEDLRTELSLTEEDLVLIAGSTHEGEESVVCGIYGRLKFKYPRLKLILVPRHPERFDRVEEIIKSERLQYTKFSQNKALASQKRPDVLLVDTMGQLTKLYSLANIAFVGGTIARIGGHNLMEPFVYKVPVVSGPQVFKIRDTADQLSRLKAAFIVQSEEELEEKIDYLLSHEAEREAMGLRGYEYLIANLGATKRALEFLNATIGGPGMKLQNERMHSSARKSEKYGSHLQRNGHRMESKVI